VCDYFCCCFYFIFFLLVFLVPLLEVESPSLLLCNYSKFLGFSFFSCLLSDYWTLCTLHIRLFQFLIAKIFRFYLVLMVSLFRLFCGKKWNVLRKRVDSSEYSMNQLLVGMLLFSILFCTFPTILAYYALFTLSLVFVLVVKSGLDTVSIVLNTFPVYILFLKLTNDPILADSFNLHPHDLNSRTPSFLLFLGTRRFSDIFSQMLRQIQDCWASLLNFNNLRNVICGESIY
jgi:hypothetical protein